LSIDGFKIGSLLSCLLYGDMEKLKEELCLKILTISGSLEAKYKEKSVVQDFCTVLDKAVLSRKIFNSLFLTLMVGGLTWDTL